MSPIWVGDTKVDGVWVGATKATAVYLGAQKVWPGDINNDGVSHNGIGSRGPLSFNHPAGNPERNCVIAYVQTKSGLGNAAQGSVTYGGVQMQPIGVAGLNTNMIWEVYGLMNPLAGQQQFNVPQRGATIQIITAAVMSFTNVGSWSDLVAAAGSGTSISQPYSNVVEGQRLLHGLTIDPLFEGQLQTYTGIQEQYVSRFNNTFPGAPLIIGTSLINTTIGATFRARSSSSASSWGQTTYRTHTVRLNP